jgi:hypothetical protein
MAKGDFFLFRKLRNGSDSSFGDILTSLLKMIAE